MPYRIWATDDIPSPADMNAMTADAQQADVAAQQGPYSSTAYGNLTTVGPALTFTLVANQMVLLFISFYGVTATQGGNGWAAAAITGASTFGPNDADGAHYFAVKVGTSTAGMVGRGQAYAATNPGSHTATVRYRGDGTNNMNFADRRLVAKKH